MRRKDREMDKEFALMVIDKCEYAFLSTINEDLTPYCVPITIVRDGEYIYFHCAKEGKKIDNIKRNPNVCMAFVGDTNIPPNEFTTEFESAILTGKAENVICDNEKIHALKILCERHTPLNMSNFELAIEKSLKRTDVWKLKIEEITGKRKKYDEKGEEMKFGRME